MPNYSKSAASAAKMLTKFGQTVVLRKITAGVYDPATGSAESTQTDENRKGVIIDYGTTVYGGTDMIAGTLILEGDRRLYMSAQGLVPAANDQVIIGGVIWHIKNVRTTDPAGIAVLYDLLIRR